MQLVNSIAPFVLTARLKPLMLRVPSKDKHVVSVAAMEGQVYRNFKSTRHPHTNMSKAALNMATVHLAAALRETNIKVNSAHPGWVRTEMGTDAAPMNVQDGAKTSVALALLGPDGPTGRHIHLGDEIPW